VIEEVVSDEKPGSAERMSDESISVVGRMQTDHIPADQSTLSS